MEAKSFFIYVFKLSASNFGRGDAADERDGGERTPEGTCAMREYNSLEKEMRTLAVVKRQRMGLLDVVCLELSHVHAIGRASFLTLSQLQRRSSSELL